MSKVKLFVSLAYITIIFITVKFSALYASKLLSWLILVPVTLSSRPQPVSPTVKQLSETLKANWSRQTGEENQIYMCHQTCGGFAIIIIIIIISSCSPAILPRPGCSHRKCGHDGVRKTQFWGQHIKQRNLRKLKGDGKIMKKNNLEKETL